MQVKFCLDPKERLHLWEMPLPGEEYIVGGDVSEGLEGGDNSCAQILKRSGFTQVGVWHGMIEPYDFGRTLAYIGYYFNTALLAIERNANGITSIDHLRTINYPNIYKMQKFDYEVMDYTDRLGWITNAHTRGLIVDSLRDSVRENSIIINDPETLAEMKTFVRDKRTGKIKASTGNFDDRVMALAIANYIHRTKYMATAAKAEDFRKQFEDPGAGSLMRVPGRGGY